MLMGVLTLFVVFLLEPRSSTRELDRLAAKHGRFLQTTKEEGKKADVAGEHMYWDTRVIPKIEAFFDKMSTASSIRLFEGVWKAADGSSKGGEDEGGDLIGMVNGSEGMTEGHVRVFIERHSNQ